MEELAEAVDGGEREGSIPSNPKSDPSPIDRRSDDEAEEGGAAASISGSEGFEEEEEEDTETGNPCVKDDRFFLIDDSVSLIVTLPSRSFF